MSRVCMYIWSFILIFLRLLQDVRLKALSLVHDIIECILLNKLQSSPTRELRSQPNVVPGCLSSEGIKRKGDFVFQTGHVIEIVTKLFLVVQNATGKPPHVNIATEFEANFGAGSVTFNFKRSASGHHHATSSMTMTSSGSVAADLHRAHYTQAKLVKRGNKMDIFLWNFSWKREESKKIP